MMMNTRNIREPFTDFIVKSRCVELKTMKNKGHTLILSHLNFNITSSNNSHFIFWINQYNLLLSSRLSSYYLEQAFSTGGARATCGACGQLEWRAAVPRN